MEVVKESGGKKFFKKRSGRFAVRDKDGKWINGNDKVKALVEAGLIKVAIPKVEAPVLEPVAEEAPEEEAAEGGEES